MVELIRGCNTSLKFAANELTSNNYVYTLPTGYSINIIHITTAVNIQDINNASVIDGTRLIFPVVNSKSPSSFSVFIRDLTKDAELRFTIEKFGQMPDKTYFYHEFYPILVTDDDGNKYNIIPSDQFK